MKKAEDLTVKDWVVGGVVGGIAGFLLGFLSKTPITQWKQKHGLDQNHRIHHADIGGTMATLGALSAHTNPFAPAVVGFGTGLAIEDYADELGLRVMAKKIMRAEPEPKPEVFVQPSESIVPTVHWERVPDFPPAMRYKAMVEIIRRIIYEDTNHPEVRRTAEEIIKGAGLDGRDTDAILSAFTLWMRENITYIHDAARDNLGKPTDQYRHAYLVLPPTDTNPKGTGTGDCDCLFILWAAMAMSVGIENIVGLLVAQQKPGIYNHIMGAMVPPGARYDDIKSLVGHELTEDQPIGWIPPAKGYGVVRL